MGKERILLAFDELAFFASSFPICWPEPFGLVMIEALACGTPVLAYRAGAVAEVVDEGDRHDRDNIDQARIASARVAALDRRKVRRRFEERFTARQMAKDYVRLSEPRLSRCAAGAQHETAERDPTPFTARVLERRSRAGRGEV